MPGSAYTGAVVLAVLLACRAAVAPPTSAVAPVTANWMVASRHPGQPLVIAHRGASREAPENTMAAYRLALELGATAVETDVHTTLDGEVLVIHDPTTERTTGVPRVVAETTAAELRTLDGGSWKGAAYAGERLPLLGELLDLVRGRAVLCLELKSGKELVPRVVELIDQRAMRGDIVLFSFDAALLSEGKAAMPDVPALLLAKPSGQPPSYGPAHVEEAVALGADLVGFAHRALPREAVEEAHRRGLPVFSWTVNTPDDARRLRDWGVDGLITDDPAMVVAALASP